MSSSSFEITEKCIGSAPQFDNTQDWIYELDNPYLHGAYAPTTDEIAIDDLEVIGELPDDLFGAYYRNGPNPVFKPKNLYHPFDGDGMVHAVYIRGGKASYRNSYIHTAALQHELAPARRTLVILRFHSRDAAHDSCRRPVALHQNQERRAG